MNRLALAVALWLCVGLEMALRQTLGIGYSSAGIGGPSPVFALVAVIACFAPAPLIGTLWFAFVSGLCLDLTWAVPIAGGPAAHSLSGSVTIVGPHALGHLAGSWIILKCRRVIVRQNPFAVTVVAVVGALVAHAVALAALLARDTLDPLVALPPQGLARLVGGLYTGVPAFVLALCAKWLLPLLGLPDPTDRRALYGRTTA